MEHGEQTVLRAIAALAKQIPHKVVLEDQTFKTLTYQRLLVGTDVLAAQWAKRLDPNTERVGVLLPNVNQHGGDAHQSLGLKQGR